LNSLLIQPVGAGKFVFTGTANDSISGTMSPLIDVLEIAKSPTAKLSIGQNVNIGTAVNFTTGNIDLGNANLLLQSSALLKNESATSRLTASGNGYAGITVTLNAPNAVNVGNLGAVISSAQILGSTSVRRGFTVSRSGNDSSMMRYYDIIPANDAALNATLRINYFDAELNGIDESKLMFWKSVDNITWQKQSYTNRDANLNYAELTGISDFSRWTLSSANSVLPISLLNFTATVQDCKTQLNWKTITELNADHFELERSGNSFNTITTVAAKGSNSTYAYTDESPLAGNSFYRLKMVDKDGSYTYSNIVTANVNCAAAAIAAWPNPTAGRTVISNIHTNDKINIYNATGQIILQQIATGITQNIDLSAQPNGIYAIVITNTKGQMIGSFKLLKTK
jgi:hypothetical protein